MKRRLESQAARASPDSAPPPTPWGFRFAAIVIVAAWVGLFAPQLFAARTFVLGDAGVYYPFEEFSRARWHEAHQRTLWNPYVFCGIASAASLADPRPQYLPDLALDAIETLYRLPCWPPLAAPLLAHLAGMLALALLARALWRAGGVGMAWAGLSWGLMTNLIVPLTFGHHAKFFAASLMPVVLLLVHYLFAAATTRAALTAALGLALAMGVQCLGGHPQIVVYSAALAGVFAVERAWAFRRAWRLAPALGAALFGAVLSAGVWLPALLYGIQSTRGAGVTMEAITPFSLRPRDLLSLVWPWAVGHSSPSYWGGLVATDYPQYFGVTTVALALLAWRRRERRGLGPLTFFTGAALIGIVFSLGSRLGAAFQILSAALPFATTFRVAVMALFVAQLGVAMLSARGLERAFAATDGAVPARFRAALLVALIAMLALVAGALIARGPLHQGYAAAMLHARPQLAADLAARTASHAGVDLVLRGLLLAALALALAAAAMGRARLAGAVVIAALTLDLAPVSLPYLRRASGTESQMRPGPTTLERVAASDSLYRCMPLRGRDLFTNRPVLSRARSLGGMHGTMPANYGDLMRAGLPRHYGVICALAVRYIDADTAAVIDASLYEPVAESGAPPRVWRVRRALPRAYAVTDVFRGDDSSILRAMASASFVPAEVAASDEAGATGRFPGSRGAGIRWLLDEPDRLELEVGATAPAFVVVADAYFPGWSATLDGARVPIYRVDHMLRGVKVPEGRHRLAMRYVPAGWALGVALTRVGFAVWLALALLWLATGTRGTSRAMGARPAMAVGGT